MAQGETLEACAEKTRWLVHPGTGVFDPYVEIILREVWVHGERLGLWIQAHYDEMMREIED